MSAALGLYLGVGLLIAGSYLWILATDEEERREFDRETGLDFLPEPESIRWLVFLIASPILPLLAATAVLHGLWEALRGDGE